MLNRQEIFIKFFGLRVMPFLTWNLAKTKYGYTSETICQCNSSEPLNKFSLNIAVMTDILRIRADLLEFFF